MKMLARRSLEADRRFGPIVEEKWWVDSYDPRKRRKPDLRAAFNGLDIAFEMQPSATYINVIRGRRHFYRERGALLFWVFPKLYPELLKLYHEDVFVANNFNIFQIDEESTEHSIRTGKFSLRCHYCSPAVNSNISSEVWHSRIVSIDEMTLDPKRQEVYFFDYRSMRSRIEPLETIDESEVLRRDFEEFWKEHGGRYTSSGQERYSPIRGQFLKAGISVPQSYTSQPFNSLVSLLLSAKHGVSVGYGHPKFISVAHTAFERHKPLLYAFGCVCRLHGSDKVLDEQDRTKKWAGRREIIKEGIGRKDTEYLPDIQYADVAEFLIPGLGMRLRKKQARWLGRNAP